MGYIIGTYGLQYIWQPFARDSRLDQFVFSMIIGNMPPNF